MSKPWQQLLAGMVVALCSAALGYGISQRELGVQTAVNSRDIQHLKEQDSQIVASFQEERRRTDERIFQLVDLVKKVLETENQHIRQGDELIALIKLQNNMK